MKKIILLPLIISAIFLFFANSCTNISTSDSEDIVLENEQIKLVIGNNGIAKNLIYKPTGEECLEQGQNIPIFSVTQERPFHNEIKLAYPTKMMKFNAKSVTRNGNELIVDFELIFYKARIQVDITPQYINFTVKEFFIADNDYGAGVNTGIMPPVYEMTFIQLPVRNREHFGEWLNVSWDDKIAVNVLATDIHARIDAEKREGYRIMNAAVERDIQLLDVGAALIVCKPEELLDNIARVEEDFDLPRGAASRQHKLYNSSYYAAYDITPDNIDEHIKYVKMGGFRTMQLSIGSIVETGRSWSEYGNIYPNGREDLEKLLKKIKSQGIAPGIHIMHPHIGRDSRYVTPIPDHRLNLLKYFTVSKALGMSDTEIFVEQNPQNTTMADGMRVLKVGTELISYKGYTTTFPFKFTGCERGIDNTTINSQPKGNIIGLLGSVYIDQNTSLQDEIAEKLANIYNAGFEFVYFDGSEGVNPPFWFNVSYGQWKVYSKFDPEPIFSEGAAKSHFSWHMISGGNAFDVFGADVLKEKIKRWPAEQAERMKEDFSRVDFGWLGYFVPNERSVGTQPDMIEFATSLAAGWDCPASFDADLNAFKAHARTLDNLEVYRRWEEVRAKNWLTDKQKKMLQNGEQEHILLVNEKQEFELIPYDQITDVANGNRDIRAFVFQRDGDWYVVYWHISGSKKLELPLGNSKVKLYETLDKEAEITNLENNIISVPVSDRRYLKGSKGAKEELINAFRNAKIVD